MIENYELILYFRFIVSFLPTLSGISYLLTNMYAHMR